MTCILNQQFKSPYSELLPFSGFYTPGGKIPLPWPSQGQVQLGTSPIAQSPPKLFQLSSPRPAQQLTLPHPFLLWEISMRTFSTCFPLTLSASGHPLGSLSWLCVVWHTSHPSFWELRVTSYLFHGIPLLICWPHQTWIKPRSQVHFKQCILAQFWKNYTFLKSLQKIKIKSIMIYLCIVV